MDEGKKDRMIVNRQTDLKSKFFRLFSLSMGFSAVILTSGCIGASILEDEDDQPLGNFPSLNSVPDRPLKKPHEAHVSEISDLTSTHKENTKKNKHLRQKYGVTDSKECD